MPDVKKLNDFVCVVVNHNVGRTNKLTSASDFGQSSNAWKNSQPLDAVGDSLRQL